MSQHDTLISTISADRLRYGLIIYVSIEIEADLALPATYVLPGKGAAQALSRAIWSSAHVSQHYTVEAGGFRPSITVPIFYKPVQTYGERLVIKP